MTISQDAKADLRWWKDNIMTGLCHIKQYIFALEIFSDASLSGWGAVCKGKTAKGNWSVGEKENHINYLELMAAYFALRCFASDQSQCEILLRIDNTTAISYINRMGSVQFPQLNNLAKQIWKWCEVRDLWIYASYIKSKDNLEADYESRSSNLDIEWELSEEVFQKIVGTLGYPTIDLFASRVTTSLTCSTYPGGLCIIRESMKRRMIPNDAIDVMIASLAKNSLRQYDSCLRQWWQFCKSHNEDLVSISVPKIISYLMLIFKKGASYQTLNCHRSALSLIIGSNLGNDDRIKRWFKGVYKLRPCIPRYSSTWDPATVLSYLKHWFPLETLDLRKLTLKSAMLLALTTGQRVQTLSLIKFNNIIHREEGIDIILTDIQKTSAPGRFMNKLSLPFFINNPDICPAKTLLQYLKVTNGLRRNSNCVRLFLTVKSPHKPASTQTISRWLKSVMKVSGIDVNKFTSHSTRHAASSQAHRAGLTTDSILRAVGWSSRSTTFARHYNRPLISDDNAQDLFARSVVLPST
ncbi:hypothetical protein MSG28_010551 [Choristoneura fumiferana]|uniref:Uncharacterized protein n=1 Tax=Choristoneura fumiferana TaxID=7141 RepID=A0ACC0KLS9_CHOFU|nr:hypothetical protein MSG28_010551 [Choristoneura fumiferana]